MNYDYKVENAEIKGTRLGVPCSDHGILSFVIELGYGGNGQGFGMIVLDTYDKDNGTRVSTPLAGSLLMCISEIWGVDWEDLKGIPCRAYHTWGDVKAIGHFTKNKWLMFSKSQMSFIVCTYEEIDCH